MNNVKLIVALDVPTAAEALEIFDELKSTGCAFKIGLQLFTAEGKQFVGKMTAAGAKIFLDLKFHDIPNTVARAGIEAVRLGVWMFNVHAAGGAEMMKQTVAAARETCVRENLIQPKIIAVTVLTSSTADTLRETGVADEPLLQVLRLAKLAQESDMDGVVASPLEAADIRKQAGNNFLIVTPGVRPDSKLQISDSKFQIDDQRRVLTPAAAIEAGADFIVVGRPILQAADRARAAREILAEMNQAD